MNKTIYAAISLLLIGIASIVPWADAQQKPNPVIIWCQDPSGNYAPCLAGNSLDYDTGGGTVNQGTVGIALPGSGGPVAGGTSTNPIRIDPTGTTTQPTNTAQINGVTPLMGSGNTGTGSQRVTEATDSQLSAGVGATGDSAATAGGTGSINAKLRLLSSQLDSIQTAVQLIDNVVSGAGVNVSQINGVTPLMGSGNTGTGSHRVTEATDSQLSAGVGATGDAAATAGSTGSLNSKIRLLTSQLDAIQTAVQLLDNAVSGSGFNISQINGATPLMGAGGTGTGSHRVTEANDSQLSAGVGATGDSAATAGSTGSITAKLRLMTSQLDTISTAIAAIQTALQLIDDDQTGASIHYRTSSGSTEDEHEVKGSAGRLFSITATNTNAATRYLRCSNQVIGSTTPGTTTVFLGLAIPGATTGAGFTTNFGPAGIAFSTGLTCWLVTGAADSDVAEVAANEIKVNYVYK